MLRIPTAWAAPFALLAGLACANVQADEINIPSFNAQNIAGWDLSVRENYRSGSGPDRSRFPLHGPAVVGDWLRLNTAQARRQHAYATAPGTLDPSLPIHISYEFLSWTDDNAAPRMMGFQLFDADLANSVDHLDYCGSKFAPVRVMHGNFDGWAPNCFYPTKMDDEERVQVWGPGKSLLAHTKSPVKLACRDTKFVAIDKSWHCATREEAIANGFVRTVDAWLTPKDNGAGYRLDVMIDGVDVHSDVHVPATSAERLRFGFLSKAESSAGSYAEFRNVRVSQSSMFVTKDSSETGTPLCMNVVSRLASHHAIVLGHCTGVPKEVFSRAGNELRVGSYCLTVENNINQDGARIITHACNGGRNQHWKITESGSIRTLMDGAHRCMTSNGLGAQAVRLTPCEDKPAQRFVAVKL